MSDQTAITPIKTGTRGLMLSSIEDMYRFGKYIVASNLAPKSFRTAEQVIVAVQSGAELGLSPMQSLQGLYVSQDGRVSMYGDTARALVQAHPTCEYITDDLADCDGPEDKWKVTVRIKRRDNPNETVRSFSVDDAKSAGLWKRSSTAGKPMPWSSYPKRMLYYRALGYACRDAMPDAMKGMHLAQEFDDYTDEPAKATVLKRPEIRQLDIVTEEDPGDNSDEAIEAEFTPINADDADELFG